MWTVSDRGRFSFDFGPSNGLIGAFGFSSAHIGKEDGGSLSAPVTAAETCLTILPLLYSGSGDAVGAKSECGGLFGAHP
jgi:hypothetical protein